MAFRLILVSTFLLASTDAFAPLSVVRTAQPSRVARTEAPSTGSRSTTNLPAAVRSWDFTDLAKVALTTCVAATLAMATPAMASDDGASGANAKITTGGASTLQSGRTISITRGVNLDQSDFSNQNLKGVAFQQSIVRNANFQNANLVGASFFDATLDGTDFDHADMTLANVEMAQFTRASLRNVIAKDMYVSGSTIFNGIKDLENSDWTDTYLRGDQRKYLCSHPTAKGTNPTTGADTRESLLCVD